jgi:putative lipoic acid-binding regulatory protein
MIDLSQHKLKLTYPCDWTYKVIGANDKEIIDAVKEIILNKDYKLTPSNKSKKGKFISFTLKTLVYNETHRVELYKLLQEHSKVIRVL